MYPSSPPAAELPPGGKPRSVWSPLPSPSGEEMATRDLTRDGTAVTEHDTRQTTHRVVTRITDVTKWTAEGIRIGAADPDEGTSKLAACAMYPSSPPAAELPPGGKPRSVWSPLPSPSGEEMATRDLTRDGTAVTEHDTRQTTHRVVTRITYVTKWTAECIRVGAAEPDEGTCSLTTFHICTTIDA